MATGRYAPSPSGDLHVGNLRTGMLAWLFAHSGGSTLRLRIDDLDPVTHGSVYERRQLADLAAMGITFDGDVLRQSERAEAYEEALDRLDRAGMTYPCFCSRREIREAVVAPHEHLPEGAYPGTCRDLDTRQRNVRAESRPAALRIRAEAAEVDFFDDVHGPTRGIVDDFVVRRNDGVPSYNVATILDDAAMEIEQVVRGDDLLAGTARQIWLARQLGLGEVAHAHVPLVVNDHGDRLAKRDGAVTLADLEAAGMTTEDVRRTLIGSLGFGAAADAGLADLVPSFDPARLSRDPLVWRPPVAQKKASDTE